VRLTVLSVAYPLAPVAPGTAGGAEQVLAQLDRALVERGDRSVVVAAAGSSVAGELVELKPRHGPYDDSIRAEVWMEVRSALQAAIRRYRPALVHMHGLDFARYLPETDIPVLVTLHLPPAWYTCESIAERDGVWFNCVSQTQQQQCPAIRNLLPPVPNGVDLDEYRPGEPRRDFLVTIGRICREKGTDHALDAAAFAGMPLLVAGSVYPYPEHERYFKFEVQPRLDGRSRRFIGPVAGARKRRLLARARAVLIPSLAPETSSLVAMEALALGTPVIAYPAGALSTLIRHGITGYVVEDREAMAESARHVDDIDRTRCREEAERRFDVRKTIESYLSIYSQLAGTVPPAAKSGIEIIRTPAELHALEPEWANLFERCPDAPPFLHPAWQLPWWDIFGRSELHTVALRTGGRLTALAACYLHEGRLVFIGNGISDQAGILAAGDAAARQLVEYLQRFPLDLQEIPEGSPLLSLSHRCCSVSPAVDLNQPVPARLHKNLRRSRGKLAGRGEVRLEFSASPDFLDDLFRLHAARWNAQGEAGVLADTGIEKFHRRAARELAEAGMLRMHALFLNGRVIAVAYGFARHETAYYYLGGFDPGLREFSPGALAIEAAVEHARAGGIRCFDFLRGAEPYKYLWGARDRSQFRILT
jgi:CelD/BcsL family acetyltransferase involved in cellulose biosynthesis/glycosyltransferase involved in cell wall biosynthesis